MLEMHPYRISKNFLRFPWPSSAIAGDYFKYRGDG
jgi:hypothetical protein